LVGLWLPSFLFGDMMAGSAIAAQALQRPSSASKCGRFWEQWAYVTCRFQVSRRIRRIWRTKASIPQCRF